MTRRPYYFTWCQQPESDPFPVAGAERDEFILSDGRRVYDMISTSFQANFGHSHSGICKAIQRQLETMPICSPRSSFQLKREVSDRFVSLIGLDGTVFYTVSGSESVENALKMARQISGRTKVLARSKSYHGASLGALSVTGDWRNEPHFTLDEQTIRIPEPDDDPGFTAGTKIIEQHRGEVAAIILETISGTNGVTIPKMDWFQAVQAVCDEHDVLLIIDEVLCGFGRCGSAFAFQDYDIKPDFVCSSKGITGGYIPFGAVWTSPKVSDYYANHTLSCGLTNYAHPLGLAALSAVLDVMGDAGFLAEKRALEATMADFCDRIRTNAQVVAVRSRGMLTAIELTGKAPDWPTLFASGVHAYSKGNTLILAPPFISTPERLRIELEKMETLIEAGVSSVTEERRV